jgi:E3 ubiquitin-protein ligase RNF14
MLIHVQIFYFNLFVLIQKLKDICHTRSGNCELYEHNNLGRRFGLDEEPDEDEDSDNDAWDLEPELRLCPCPICGRRNEKVSNNL